MKKKEREVVFTPVTPKFVCENCGDRCDPDDKEMIWIMDGKKEVRSTLCKNCRRLEDFE